MCKRSLSIRDVKLGKGEKTVWKVMMESIITSSLLFPAASTISSYGVASFIYEIFTCAYFCRFLASLYHVVLSTSLYHSSILSLDVLLVVWHLVILETQRWSVFLSQSCPRPLLEIWFHGSRLLPKYSSSTFKVIL